MSGQGEGGETLIDSDNDEDEEEIQDLTPGGVLFGSLKNRPPGALHRRAAFCAYSQSYLLYMWELFDKHQLLRSAMQRLNKAVAAANGAEGVPSVIVGRVRGDTSVSASAGAGLQNGTDTEVLSVMSTHGNRVFAGLSNLGSSQEAIARSNETVARSNEIIARIHGAQEREKLVRLAQQEREKRSYDLLQTLRASIDSLVVEKRLLLVEIAKRPDDDATRELLMEALQDLKTSAASKAAELSFLKEQQALQMIQDRKLEKKTQEQCNDVIHSPDNCTPVRGQEEQELGAGGDSVLRNLEEYY